MLHSHYSEGSALQQEIECSTAGAPGSIELHGAEASLQIKLVLGVLALLR